MTDRDDYQRAKSEHPADAFVWDPTNPDGSDRLDRLQRNYAQWMAKDAREQAAMTAGRAMARRREDRVTLTSVDEEEAVAARLRSDASASLGNLAPIFMDHSGHLLISEETQQQMCSLRESPPKLSWWQRQRAFAREVWETIKATWRPL